MAKRKPPHIVEMKGVNRMKLDAKTISALSAMPDDRLWYTLHLMAAGAGVDIPERKRSRIDYDALRYTLSRITEADIARANEILDDYKYFRKGGMRV